MLTHCIERFTWLEELDSDINTIQAQGISAPGRFGVSNHVKLCVGFGQFFFDNFGLMCSFGLALFVERDMVRLYDWELVRCPGKSMRKNLSGIKVIQQVKN